MRTFLILLLAASPCLGQYAERPPQSVDVRIHDPGRDAAEMAKLFRGESYSQRLDAAMKARAAQIDAKRAYEARVVTKQEASWKRAKEMYPALNDTSSMFYAYFADLLRRDRLNGIDPAAHDDYPERYAHRTAFNLGVPAQSASSALP